jgi:purine-nucleoside phosphorylase
MARYLGLQVAGLSFIANAAAGLAVEPLRHEDVLASGRLAAENFCLLTRELLRNWPADSR